MGDFVLVNCDQIPCYVSIFNSFLPVVMQWLSLYLYPAVKHNSCFYRKLLFTSNHFKKVIEQVAFTNAGWKQNLYLLSFHETR